MTTRRLERENEDKFVGELINESVDDMLANVNTFIEGVYRDLSITPPQRSPMRNNSRIFRRRTTGDHASTVSSEESSPQGATSFSTPLNSNDNVSPSTRRNMDAEIERINRICDNVDQNLRSIGLFMNSSGPNTSTEDVLTSNRAGSPSSSTSSIAALSLRTPPLTAAARNKNTQRGRPRRRRSSPIGSVAAHVIDLSDSQTNIPHHDDDEDDDVILVSANHSVVDLCTPGSVQKQPKARPSLNQKQFNRRRLTHHVEDIGDLCSQGSSSIRKRHAEKSAEPENKKSSPESTNFNSSKTASGHTPFMCPVCMESCLHRQPTSTRCGHVFCKECIEHAIRLTHKCPMCNAKIARSQIFRIYL